MNHKQSLIALIITFSLLVGCVPVTESISCSQVSSYEYSTTNPVSIAGIVVREPVFNDHYTKFENHVIMTDPEGQQCEVIVLTDKPLTVNAEIALTTNHMGYGSGRTAEGVSYLIHFFVAIGQDV